MGLAGSLIGAKSPCPPLRVQPCPELNAAFPLDTQHSLEPIDPCVMGCEDDNSWIILFSRITGVLWVSFFFSLTPREELCFFFVFFSFFFTLEFAV